MLLPKQEQKYTYTSHNLPNRGHQNSSYIMRGSTAIFRADEYTQMMVLHRDTNKGGHLPRNPKGQQSCHSLIG